MNKRQLQREGTLGLIYETVNQLVLEKGFDDMRIQDICERAGISTGAFYHYFRSKQDILFERYQMTGRFLQELAAEAETMEPLEGVCFLIREMTEYTRSREPEVLRSYVESSFRLQGEWQKRCPMPTLRRVAEELLRPALEPERAELLLEAVDLFHCGVVHKQCASLGRYLAENRPEDRFCRWLEGYSKKREA